MPLYSGVLQKLSAGNTDSHFTRREFVKIGDQHLQGLRASNYLDAILEDALGEQVSVSAVKWVTGLNVMAIQRGNGAVVRYPLWKLVFELVISSLLLFIIAGIVGGIVIAMGSLSHSGIAVIIGWAIILAPFAYLGSWFLMSLSAWRAL